MRLKVKNSGTGRPSKYRVKVIELRLLICQAFDSLDCSNINLCVDLVFRELVAMAVSLFLRTRNLSRRNSAKNTKFPPIPSINPKYIISSMLVILFPFHYGVV